MVNAGLALFIGMWSRTVAFWQLRHCLGGEQWGSTTARSPCQMVSSQSISPDTHANSLFECTCIHIESHIYIYIFLLCIWLYLYLHIFTYIYVFHMISQMFEVSLICTNEAQAFQLHLRTLGWHSSAAHGRLVKFPLLCFEIARTAWDIESLLRLYFWTIEIIYQLSCNLSNGFQWIFSIFA